MEQMQKLIQAIIPIALFNFLYALYRASESQRILTDESNSDKIETKREGNLPERGNPRKTERMGDLPPWVRKIGRNYMFGYLRGITTEEGYKKVMSRCGRSPGGKKKIKEV